jgi:hypothetical protein
MPTASISPIIDRMLSVRPEKYMSADAASRENGIAVETTSVVIQVAQEEQQHAASSTPPISPDSADALDRVRDLIALVGEGEHAHTLELGSFAISASASRERRATSTVFEPTP